MTHWRPAEARVGILSNAPGKGSGPQMHASITRMIGMCVCEYIYIFIAKPCETYIHQLGSGPHADSNAWSGLELLHPKRVRGSGMDSRV